MSVELLTIPRVYLKPPHLRHSMHHTAYAAAPGLPNAQPGADQPVEKLEFFAGVAYYVPKTIYDLFAAQGIATTERPLSRWELAEQQERR